MDLYSKGQGATEYLVLLAVVLMIALVSIALLGFFPGLAGDAKETQADSYWKSARPFGILDSMSTGKDIILIVQNNDPDMRTITQINLAGATLNGSYILNAGEKRSLNVSNVTSSACSVGNRFEYVPNITFSTVELAGLKQLGTKPVMGKCTG